MKSFIYSSFIAIICLGISCKKDDSMDNENIVRIQGLNFVPSTITIKSGESITWINESGIKHNVQAPDSSFFSADMFQDDEYTRTFTSSGTQNYECFYHSSMTGIIIIE